VVDDEFVNDRHAESDIETFWYHTLAYDTLAVRTIWIYDALNESTTSDFVSMMRSFRL